MTSVYSNIILSDFLLRGMKISDNNRYKILVVSTLSALLHDIGKALNVYQSQIRKVKKGLSNYISFGNPPHEFISAIIAYNMIKNMPLPYGLQGKSHYVACIVRNIVSLHHQALRNPFIEISRRKEITFNIGNKDRVNLQQTVKHMYHIVEKIPMNIFYAKHLLIIKDLLKEMIDIICDLRNHYQIMDKYVKSSWIQSFCRAIRELDIKYVWTRIISGLTIISDSCAVKTYYRMKYGKTEPKENSTFSVYFREVKLLVSSVERKYEPLFKNICDCSI